MKKAFIALLCIAMCGILLGFGIPRPQPALVENPVYPINYTFPRTETWYILENGDLYGDVWQRVSPIATQRVGNKVWLTDVKHVTHFHTGITVAIREDNTAWILGASGGLGDGVKNSIYWDREIPEFELLAENMLYAASGHNNVVLIDTDYYVWKLGSFLNETAIELSRTNHRAKHVHVLRNIPFIIDLEGNVGGIVGMDFVQIGVAAYDIVGCTELGAWMDIYGQVTLIPMGTRPVQDKFFSIPRVHANPQEFIMQLITHVNPVDGTAKVIDLWHDNIYTLSNIMHLTSVGSSIYAMDFDGRVHTILAGVRSSPNTDLEQIHQQFVDPEEIVGLQGGLRIRYDGAAVNRNGERLNLRQLDRVTLKTNWRDYFPIE
jgi:hypothetical protein